MPLAVDRVPAAALAPDVLVGDLRTPTHGTRTGCVEFAALFQHPLIEEPPGPSAPAEIRQRAARLTRQAAAVCQTCPVRTACLVRAIVQHDVAGCAGGTTFRQRLAIRRRLAVRVEPEDLDTLAGVTGRNRQVDHEEVLRLHNAHPDESLETLARRLGCSLSTVKRHLRQERTAPSVRPSRRPAPTVTQVLTAAAAVVNPPALRRFAA